MTKPNVLFLCTGNSARSQMAEAYLRRVAGDRVNVYSAGLEPKGIHPHTVQVLQEDGIDVSDHRSERMADYIGKMPYRYVITVCGHADKYCPSTLWADGEKLHWPFDDPAAAEGDEDSVLDTFRKVRDQIKAKIREWAAAESH